MPAVTVTPDDLAPFATIDPVKAQAMIDDALALAARAAPCILDADFAYPDAARAIIRGAVLRWNDSGSGAVTQQTAGPFNQSIDTRTTRKSMFWPSEITELQRLCEDNTSSGAFAIDVTPAGAGARHADICALNFGATYCSCGAVLTGDAPLYEVGQAE